MNLCPVLFIAVVYGLVFFLFVFRRVGGDSLPLCRRFLLLWQCNHYSLQTRLTPLGLSRLSCPLAHMHCIAYGESELG